MKGEQGVFRPHEKIDPYTLLA